jgi:Family of unknown function (DUF6152)
MSICMAPRSRPRYKRSTERVNSCALRLELRPAVVARKQEEAVPIHLEVTKPDGAKEEWMIEGGSPNSLLRHGLNKDSLPAGTEIVVDGYQARDHSLLRANGRNVTYPDGRKLFLGSSGPGAPPENATPTDKAKP